jgi:hypothetical protein
MNYKARTLEEWDQALNMGADGMSKEEYRLRDVEWVLDSCPDFDFCPICQGPKDCVWHCDSSHCTCYYCTEIEAMRGEP